MNQTGNARAAPLQPNLLNTLFRVLLCGLLTGLLLACASPVPPAPADVLPGAPLAGPASAAARAPAQSPAIGSMVRGKSRWIAVPWSELPGFEEDALHEAWNAWLKSCERPGPVFGPLCGEVRQLSIADESEQRAWMMGRLQPYRVESLSGSSEGLLTSYFEPELEGLRTASADFAVPLYQSPLGLAQRQPWYTRQEIDTLPYVQAQLKGREIVYVADAIDALVLQIQGSGRVRILQSDGSQRLVRLAYAGTNAQPYKSVGRWLLEQGAVRDASWPSIKAWVAKNPGRVNELMWSNPRTTFFREEPLSELDAMWGPKGAQGVALTPGRSIAVDPASIPYGTPVWLVSSGATAQLNKLVLAQDTGSAITGAVRADYFAGWGAAAQALAGRLTQPLRLWVLWPR